MLNEIGNTVGIILVIIGIPFLIYIAWNARKLNKERKKRLEELDEIYSGKSELNKNGGKNGL